MKKIKTLIRNIWYLMNVDLVEQRIEDVQVLKSNNEVVVKAFKSFEVAPLSDLKKMLAR